MPFRSGRGGAVAYMTARDICFACQISSLSPGNSIPDIAFCQCNWEAPDDGSNSQVFASSMGDQDEVPGC